MSYFNMFGGGGPGGGRNPREPEKKKDEVDLYKILGLEKGAKTEDVKKAFRKLVVTAHPDKGGDPEKVSISSHSVSVLLVLATSPPSLSALTVQRNYQSL
jgi:hypothetical protein